MASWDFSITALTLAQSLADAQQQLSELVLLVSPGGPSHFASRSSNAPPVESVRLSHVLPPPPPHTPTFRTRRLSNPAPSTT